MENKMENSQKLYKISDKLMNLSDGFCLIGVKKLGKKLFKLANQLNDIGHHLEYDEYINQEIPTILRKENNKD